MATLAHPTTGEFGKRSGEAGVRATLERAVDAAPSHIRPPRSRLRRLFARDRSARALIERYRLWPAIEHAYARITREYGPMPVEISAEAGWVTLMFSRSSMGMLRTPARCSNSNRWSGTKRGNCSDRPATTG